MGEAVRLLSIQGPLPEFIDPIFVKTRPKRSLKTSVLGLVFAKTGSINSGTEESVNVLVAAVTVFV